MTVTRNILWDEFSNWYIDSFQMWDTLNVVWVGLHEIKIVNTLYNYFNLECRKTVVSYWKFT